MIKANEYREGIFVMDVEPYDKVQKVDLNMIINALGKGYKYRAIPLTPEWLERCGFLENEGRFLMHNMKIAMTKNYVRDASGDYEGFVIVFNTFTGTLQQVIKTIIKVQHLHQLQNLYFALTGEELNVKL